MGVVKGTEYIHPAEGKTDHAEIHRDDPGEVKLKPLAKHESVRPKKKAKKKQSCPPLIPFDMRKKKGKTLSGLLA